MLYDVTYPLTQNDLNQASNNEKIVISGHMGTHFDIMNKEFPLEYTQAKAVVFDVSGIYEREIEITDINFELIEKNMMILFFSGWIHKEKYGTRSYFKSHPQLSMELIDALIEKKIWMVGIDFAGVRRSAEHTPTDQKFADHGIFVVENCCDLDAILNGQMLVQCTSHVYPLKMKDFSGLPCRVILEK